MTDVAALKKRFATFVALDVLAMAVVAAGFVGDLGFGQPLFRPLWIVGMAGVVAVMTWFVLGMRAGKEK